MFLWIGFTYTLWLFNIAMENGPFIHNFPSKTTIYCGFAMAMLVITRWYIFVWQTFNWELSPGEMAGHGGI